MKKRTNKIKALALLMMLAICITGCGSMNKYAMMENATMDSAGAMEYGYAEEPVEPMVEESAGGTFINGESADYENTSASNRKLIRNVDLSLETMEFDSLLTSVRAKVAELGGYIEDSSIYNGSAYEDSYYNRRHANITARIPQDSLDSFLNDVEEVANVVNRSESVEDVTLEYVDMESRKAVLLAEQERLMTFLEQAENMEDVITIESRLSEVRYEIESMESQLRTFDNKVNYSTVYMYIQEVKELTPVEEESMLTRMKSGFVDSLEDIGDGFLDFIVGFVIAIPYLVIWAVVITAIIFIIKAIVKSSKKKKGKKAEAIEEGQNEPKL